MTDLIIEPLSKLLYGITHPIQTLNILKYKKAHENASDIDFYELPLAELFQISTNDKELNLWNKFSAVIDSTFPMNKLQKTTADEELWSELKYCIKYAAYIYFMPILGNPDPIKNNIIIKEKDIPSIGHKTKHIAEPGYFIGIDDNNHRILLCIRGTMTMGDTITDLHAIPDRLSFGVNQNENGPFYYCHPGMFNAANYLHTKVNVTKKIQNYLAKKKYSNYKIFVTGHSLGAGVCSVLGLLWKSQNIFPDDKFKCFSFASPLVIDEDGVNKSLSTNDLNVNMFSIAVESDIVTRLSVKGLIQLSKRVELIRKNEDIYNTLFERIKASKINTNKITKAGQDSLSTLINVLDDTKAKDIPDLYPAGHVLWFVPDCVAENNHNNNNHLNVYRQLLSKIELETSSFSTVRLMQLLYDMICAFYVVDNNETLCEYKDINDRSEFTQMVIHGNVSFHAHSQGRYTNGFGIDLIDIFRISRNYQRLERLNIPKLIIDALLFIIIFVAFCVLRIIAFIGDIIDFIF